MSSDPSAARSTPLRAAGRIFHVPGRIEVLGKHVDYAGGRSLLCATRFGFTFDVQPRSDGRVYLHDDVSGQRVTIDPVTVHDERRRGPVWSAYPRAVVRRVREDLLGPDPAESELRALGCDVAFSSDLPSAAGLSSSSAFTTGALLAIDSVSGVLDSPRARDSIETLADLADFIGSIESGRPYIRPGTDPAAADPAAPTGVGVRGGSKDHTAILCSQPGALLEASFAPVELERMVPLPSDLVFVIGVSGVRASKASGARSRYNRLSDLATRIADLWREHTGGTEPHLGAILALGDDAPRRLREVLEREGGDDAVDMIRRVEQFRVETLELVPGAVAALEAGDLTTFGERVAASQRLAESHLGNQVPETMHLAASARERGAVAASSFGAGFGGAVWALVERDGVDEFSTAWRDDYLAAFPGRRSRARFVATDAAEPARPLPERFSNPLAGGPSTPGPLPPAPLPSRPSEP